MSKAVHEVYPAKIANHLLREYKKRINKAIKIIEDSWYSKNTIQLEDVGYSSDIRWKVWKELKGEEKIQEVMSAEELDSYLPKNEYEALNEDLMWGEDYD